MKTIRLILISILMVQTSFAEPRGPNRDVLDIAPLADGKILVVGAFTTWGTAPAPRIVRLNADGSLDTTFDPGTGPDFTILKVLLQSDGKILIAGNFKRVSGVVRTGIARLNPDGSLDTTFVASTNGPVRAIARQSNNHILIGGTFTMVNGVPKNRIARLTVGGFNDSFSASIGGNSVINSIVVKANGNILIGGDFLSVNGQSRCDVAELSPAGSVLASFVPACPLNGSVINALALQSDGKLIVGGSQGSGTPRMRLRRFESDGTLDSSFSAEEPLGSIASLLIQSDGKLLIGGKAANPLARINTDGSPDEDFEIGDGPNGSVNALALQADLSLLIGGNFSRVNGSPRQRIALLTEDGSLVSGFFP